MASKFTTENNKIFKTETRKTEVDLKDIYPQISYLQSQIKSTEEDLIEMKNDLLELLKLQDAKKIS